MDTDTTYWTMMFSGWSSFARYKMLTTTVATQRILVLLKHLLTRNLHHSGVKQFWFRQVKWHQLGQRGKLCSRLNLECGEGDSGGNYIANTKNYPFIHIHLSVSNLGFGLSYKIWRWNSNIFSFLGFFLEKCTLILIDSHQPVVLVLLERAWNHMSFEISASKILELSTLTSKDQLKLWRFRHVASSCMVYWFTFSSCVPWKENCTKPKRLTHVITHHFSKGFSFNNQLFFSKNSFGFTTTQTNYHGSWWTKIPMWSKKPDAEKSRHRGQIHEWHFSPPGWKLESTNQKNVTENSLCWFFTIQTQKDIITQLVFQFVVFFLKGFLNN